MADNPRDVIIERVGSRFFVGYRKLGKMGMGVGTYAEARRWAEQMAATGSGRIIERTFVKHASMKRTRGVALVQTPCGVMGLPKNGKSVTTSRGRQLARHGNMKMQFLNANHYRISDRDAGRLAKGVGRKLPKHGYMLVVVLPSGHRAELLRTPYRHAANAPKRGWVWAVMPERSWKPTEASGVTRADPMRGAMHGNARTGVPMYAPAQYATMFVTVEYADGTVKIKTWRGSSAKSIRKAAKEHYKGTRVSFGRIMWHVR